MTRALATAIRESRRIRRNLVRAREDRYLSGDCGLASTLLAAAIRSPESLRCVDGGSGWHAYNVVDGTIIDITATQFNADVDEPTVRGVLVTDEPRSYHVGYTRNDRIRRGEAVIKHLKRVPWYGGDAYAGIRCERAVDFLLRIVAQRKRAMP